MKGGLRGYKLNQIIVPDISSNRVHKIVVNVDLYVATWHCPFSYLDIAAGERMKQKTEGPWLRRVDDGEGAVQDPSVN